MPEDPIVAEVRKHRQERAARFGYDLRKMIEDAQRREGKDGHPVVVPPRRQKTK